MAKNKKDKELKRRFGKLAESMSEYYHQLDLRKLENIDDDAFAYIMKNVKGVNMLDLNETDISHESIRLLENLEYVNELRARGCRHLSNEAIPYLNKLFSLKLLHVKSTPITIDGLLQLKLPGLEELYFSAGEKDSIEEKMKRLRSNLPGCNFIIDGKPWEI